MHAPAIVNADWQTWFSFKFQLAANISYDTNCSQNCFRSVSGKHLVTYLVTFGDIFDISRLVNFLKKKNI